MVFNCLQYQKCSANGEAKAHAVFDVLKERKIDKVYKTCFDTVRTWVGTWGHASFYSHFLSAIFCTSLELIAGAAFAKSMGSSSAPEVLLFKRYQVHWKFIDQDRFEDSSTDQLTADCE
jgi:hypothetical protein